MTTPGGGGFTAGDDFVSLRLSMDIPDQGVAGLRSLIQEVDRLKVSAEAAYRSEDQFVRMLEAQATAADRAAAAIRNLTLAQQQGLGGSQLNAPGQYVSPFAGTTAGMGMGRVPATIPEMQDALEQLRSVSPRNYLHKMDASGFLRAGDVPASAPSDEDLAQAAQRVSAREMVVSGQGRGVAGSVLNEFGPGAAASEAVRRQLAGVSASTAAGVGPAEQAVAQAASKAPGAFEPGGAGLSMFVGAGGAAKGAGGLLESLGLGGAADAAGPIAAILGSAMAIQKGGQAMQGWRAMGSVRGGGIGEGMGYEMDIRTMALNPFITTEQARQIVQQGLTEGYTGKTFDTVTGFVAHNLQQMNLDVSSSFAMVRKNVDEGGESIAALNSNLQTMFELSKTGAQSFPTLAAGYQATSAAGVQAGMAGPQAGQYAMIMSQMFGNIPGMKGTGAQLGQAFLSPQALPYLEYQGGLNVPQGILPGAVPGWLSSQPNGGQMLAQAGSNVVKYWALQYYNSYGRPAKGTGAYWNAVWLFSQRLQTLNVPWAGNLNQVATAFDAYIQGKDPEQEAQGEVNRAQEQQTQVGERSQGTRIRSAIGSALPLFGVGGWLGVAAGTYEAAKNYKSGGEYNFLDQFPGGRWLQQKLGIRGHEAGQYKIPALDAVINAYGGTGGIDVLDENGRPVKLDQNNRDQMNNLAAGKWTVRPKGQEGAGIPLSKVPMTGATPTDVRAMVGGQLTIGLTPEARQLISAPQTVRLTPHEQAANRADTDYNGNTMALNNAPAGYQLPRQYAPGGW